MCWDELRFNVNRAFSEYAVANLIFLLGEFTVDDEIVPPDPVMFCPMSQVV